MNASVSSSMSDQNNNLGASTQNELQEFAASLFEQCGGMVEWDDAADVGTALLPENVADLLGVSESVRLATQQRSGALCVNLASDFLDLAQKTLDSLVARVGTFHVPDLYLKKGDLQSIVDRTFTWHNARVRMRGAEPEFVAYHAWWFFASLKSEDVWEGQLNITINSASGAAVDLPNLLNLWELEPCQEPDLVRPEETFDIALKSAQSRLLDEAAGFIARMESRLERDRKRLRDYYGALSREAGSTKRRGTEPPSKEEINAGKRAVGLELERKLLELTERYQIEASLEPIVLACVGMNALAIEILVQRKRAERRLHLYWNPLTKQLESLACTHCGRGTYSVAFADEDASPLCVECHASKTPHG
jgi:hypothetical protein